MLELSEARDHREKRIKSPFHQKSTIESKPEKINSPYERGIDLTSSEFPIRRESTKTDKNGEYFHGKERRHSAYNYNLNKIPRKCFEFSENIEFESKHVKHYLPFSFHQEVTENAKQEVKFGPKTFSNVSLARESMNENTSPNVDSYSQTQNKPCTFSHNQRHFNKRKVDSFQLNNFEDVKRSRRNEWFVSNQEKTPVMNENKRKYPKQQQERIATKYCNIEEQVK